MLEGCIFDIREFTVHDGPGIRITIFMKGCPLRCKWCHNPEGLDASPQLSPSTGRRIGRYYTVDELVQRCLPFKDVFDMSGGGVTFSGGEPTAQSEFLLAAVDAFRRQGIHITLDTSGYCKQEVFEKIIGTIDLCYFDLKCMDPLLHRRMTGKDNSLILDNLSLLVNTDIPFVLRIPMIPGVSDTMENLRALDSYVKGLKRQPERIDRLRFNEFAAAKYASLGLRYGFCLTASKD